MNSMTLRGMIGVWLSMVAAVAVLSVVPAAAPPGVLGADKIVHTAAYLVLATIPAALLPGAAALRIAMLLLVVVGTGVELAQLYIPGRDGSAVDVLANIAGILLGAWVGRQFCRRRIAARIKASSTGTGVRPPRGPDT